MHSMSYAASRFDIEVTYVSPPDMTLGDDLKRELDQRNLRYRELEHIEQAIADADVVYIEPVVQADYTQSRVERAEDTGRTADNFRVTRELMRKAKSDCMVFHSLPRMDELPVDVDDTRHAYYWLEAYNAVVTKMALLALVLGAVE